jgi:hypothetical protein
MRNNFTLRGSQYGGTCSTDVFGQYFFEDEVATTVITTKSSPHS